MERINAICHHPRWQHYIHTIANLEQDRIFCRHDTGHLLDVARLAQLDNLRHGGRIPKAWIYGAALLHDIGRFQEYQDGTPHDQASAQLAVEILADCGFTPEERRIICHAIASHRTPGTERLQNLDGLLYRADKKSRACLFCPARAQCNWPREKMNLDLEE